MRSPIINIDLSGQNISGFISSFKYDDSVDKDNVLEIRIKEELVLTLLNNQDLVAGNKLVFNFGYLGGVLSETNEAIISDIDVNYDSSGPAATIKALDKGHFSKKKTDNKIWKNKTISDIASEIADKYGFEKEILETKTVYANLPQGNMTDFDFLTELALKENNCIFFIRNNTLYLVERGLGNGSLITYTYGTDEVVLFRPTTKLSKSSGISDKTSIAVFDDENKSNSNVEVTNQNEEKVITTKGVFIDSDKGELKDVVEGNRQVVKGTDNVDEAKNITNSIKKKDALSTTSASLTVVGIPTLQPNTIITVDNVAERHLGNWLIQTITHSIQVGGGYTSVMKLTSRGSRTGDIRASNQNKTIGGKNVSTSKEVKRVKIDSVNGRIIE